MGSLLKRTEEQPQKCEPVTHKKNFFSPLRIVPLVLFAFGLILTFLASKFVLDEQEKRLVKIFDYRVAQSLIRIENRLNSYQQIMEDIASLLTLKPDLSESEFRLIIQRLHLDTRFPGTQGIGYTRAFTPKNLEDYLIKQKIVRPGFDYRPKGVRDTYGIVTYMEPLNNSNKKVVGVDLMSAPERSVALINSRDTGKPAVSGRLVLVQDLGQGDIAGVLLATPFYRYGSAVDTLEERRANISGWVGAPLRISDLFTGILGKDFAVSSLLYLKVFDINNSGTAELLFQSNLGEMAAPVAPYCSVHDLSFGGRVWRIEFAVLDGFKKNAGYQWPYSIVILGSLGSLLLAAVFWLLINGRNSAILLAQQMTQELRESKDLFHSVVEGTDDAVFIKDAEGKFLFANTTMNQWFAFPETGEIVGCSTEQICSPDVFAVLRAEDLRTMSEGGLHRIERVQTTRDGEVRALHITKGPLRNPEGTITGVFGFIKDVTKQKAVQDLVWHQANYDPLTDLPNRRLFRDRLQSEMRRAHRHNCLLAILFIDLDNFKDVNDSMGHDQGDRLLVEASKRISGCIRESDTVARMGGDEFILIIPDMIDVDSASQIAQGLLNELSKPFQLGSGLVYISASIGITIYPSDARNDVTLIQNADQALYAAKSQGRNSYNYFTQEMQLKAQQKMQLATDLRHALAEGQLSVYFQPIIIPDCQYILKAEALLRWHHPVFGDIPPSVFIPVAEETGLIVEIGDWVFKQSAYFILQWKKRLESICSVPEGFPNVSVNMSPKQFSGQTDVLSWSKFLQEHHIPCGSLIIEITEGLLLERNPCVQEKLAQLSEAGMALALDDFGTGYSAMSYLKKFSVDFIKIDRSFISDMETDQNDQAIVQAIILMAHTLGIEVIAEGVETVEQSTLLLQSSCNYLQGFFFGHPTPSGQFLEQFVSST